MHPARVERKTHRSKEKRSTRKRCEWLRPKDWNSLSNELCDVAFAELLEELWAGIRAVMSSLPGAVLVSQGPS